jgi:hypothetical protein
MKLRFLGRWPDPASVVLLLAGSVVAVSLGLIRILQLG